jgi:hypothetical protein
MAVAVEKFQSLPTDYREYRGASKAELGYGEEAISARFFEYTAENGQLVGVYETKPLDNKSQSSPERTIIMPASHDYRIEPTWMKRADIIASSADARVVLVDMPGTTGLLQAKADNSWETYETTKRLKGARQTPLQAAKALAGDFRNHARVQLEAIAGTAGLTKEDEIILLGESMGAQVVTDMLALAEEKDLTVSQVVLYEAVNAFKGYDIKVPLRLMKVLATTEKDRRTHYIVENSLIGHPATAFEMDVADPFQKELDAARKTIGQQGIAAAVNGLGLGRGVNARLERTLLTVPKSNRPEVTLVKGAESLATLNEDYASLHEVLKQLGLKPQVFEVTDDVDTPYPMGHSHLFSLARQKQVADKLFSQQ